MQKYAVPAGQAANARRNLGVTDKSVPVLYASKYQSFEVNVLNRHYKRALARLKKKTESQRYDAAPQLCVVWQALHEAGYKAWVGMRKTAILKKDRSGKQVIYLYQHTSTETGKIVKFDKRGKFIECTFLLSPWPTSWLPEARRKRAKLRHERMKRPDFVPAPYNKRKHSLCRRTRHDPLAA